MYECHFWLLLRESTSDVDGGSLELKLQEIRRLIADKLPDAIPACPVHELNYEHLLQGSVAHNHRGDTHVRLLAVLSAIAESLPGSYGLVYWHDDEIRDSRSSNRYNVIVVVRGTISDRADPFLSPVSPMLED